MLLAPNGKGFRTLALAREAVELHAWGIPCNR
jgi:hypothetical protein